MGGFANNAPIVTDGLVFYVDAGNGNSYPGSGTTWGDLVGGNDGTLEPVAGPTYDSANGGSIVFDGADDYSVATSALSTTGGSGSAQTYDVWFRADNVSTYGSLFCWDSYNYIGVYNTGEVFIATNGDNSLGDFASTPTASAATWHNAVFVFDQGSAYKLHLDGVDYGSVATTDTSPLSTRQPLIGARYAPYPAIDFYFDGRIASVKAYNRELTSAETQQNYNALKNRFV